ncbi:uncharacterized protein LOC142164057 [Nicotiana tabacum]|uniref:Uncharacterized protein LOC142164057 n=1 Tax=Nicotiana tabacum TaxID=4097 RepID=A0AC58RX62_TOBAC
MEYLNRLLKTLKYNPDFNFHPKCDKMGIVQLGFADNLLLFCRGDVVSVQLLYQCFKEFPKASRLVANNDKSSIYFGGVANDIQQEIIETLGFMKGIFLLPKKIVSLIAAACRKFLWNGGITLTKKALLAWNIVCYPKSAGGFNVLDIHVWNKAAITSSCGTYAKRKVNYGSNGFTYTMGKDVTYGK